MCGQVHFLQGLARRSFNTAKGLAPLRLYNPETLRFDHHQFQYRERVGPFAAQGGSMKGPIDVLFQYRERVGPFAAHHIDTYQY